MRSLFDKTPIFCYIYNVVESAVLALLAQTVHGGSVLLCSHMGCLLPTVVGLRQQGVNLENFMSIVVPGALSHLIANAYRFSEAGLTGLVKNAEVANKLGEALERGEITLDQVIALVGSAASVPECDVAAFWSVFWQRVLGKQVVVPPMPALKSRTIEAMQEFDFRQLVLPKIVESDYPARFVKPAWSKYLTVSEIKRRPLEGRWVLVETIAKPDYTNPMGYGDDPLGKALGIDTRFCKSWDELHADIFPRVANLLGVHRRAVRSPSGEEWNLVGNVFNELRTKHGENTPDLGSTNAWEWCENACGSDSRLVAGSRGGGGLDAVYRHWSNDRVECIGFRVLVVP